MNVQILRRGLIALGLVVAGVITAPAALARNHVSIGLGFYGPGYGVGFNDCVNCYRYRTHYSPAYYSGYYAPAYYYDPAPAYYYDPYPVYGTVYYGGYYGGHRGYYHDYHHGSWHGDGHQSRGSYYHHH